MSEARILEWRRTIFLFHELKKAHWRGPFAAAGYRWPIEGHPPYIVGRSVLHRDGGNLTPDIISASATAWAVLDLTIDEESKKEKLDRYSSIDPRSLATYGLPPPAGKPNLFAVRMSPGDDGGHAQLLVGSQLRTENLQRVTDPNLQSALRTADGADLTRIPEIPIAFVPESRPAEIRIGLVDLIMDLFGPAKPKRSVSDFVELGLERLSPCVSNEDKNKLIARVDAELKTLVKGRPAPLKDDIELIDGLYQAKPDTGWHSKRLERIERILRDWAKEGLPAKMRELSEFDPS